MYLAPSSLPHRIVTEDLNCSRILGRAMMMIGGGVRIVFAIVFYPVENITVGKLCLQEVCVCVCVCVLFFEMESDS